MFFQQAFQDVGTKEMERFDKSSKSTSFMKDTKTVMMQSTFACFPEFGYYVLKYHVYKIHDFSSKCIRNFFTQ